MPSISRERSEAEIASILSAIRRAEKARDANALILELRAGIGHPCAPHALYVPELWDRIAKCYRELGEFDAAIDAKERSIAEGDRSWPDPRADIAEFHLLAGRTQEAAELFAKLRLEHPEDIWLYNHAGFAYASTGENESAAAWFGEGIDVAIAAGDPEGIVDQMNEARTASLAALGRTPDELTRRAEGFIEGWMQPAAGARQEAPGGEAPARRACKHCGFDPEIEYGGLNGISSRRPVPSPVELAVAWFPEPDYTQALKLWPELNERFTDLNHEGYCRALQADLLELDAAIIARHPAVAPVRLKEYLPWCAEQGLDAGEAASRSYYAAELLRTTRVIRWPPGRNEPCWCASGKKYKRCCASGTTQSDGG